MDRNYWAFRIDNDKRNYLFEEIKQGRLRQGWGYSKDQDLRQDYNKIDINARRNLPIFNKVRKGDYILIPHVESWDEIAIVRATEHFNDPEKGYRFDIPEYGDYGHIFPVEYIKRFSKQNINVEGSIRETFKCRSRFWNINRCAEDIEKILKIDEEELISKSGFDDRFRNRIISAFNEEAFADCIYDALNSATQAYEWEFVLCEGLKKILPNSYSIQTTSNKEEDKHGADIIIRIPGLLDISYVIAIQVKDYDEKVEDWIVGQINKADEYFKKENGELLIDKYLIITKAQKELNQELIKKASAAGVTVLFDKEVKRLLSKMAKAYLCEMDNE